MTDLFLLSEAQMRRIEPFFPLSHGVPRVDDRRVISGIVFVIRNGLRWRDSALHPLGIGRGQKKCPAQAGRGYGVPGAAQITRARTRALLQYGRRSLAV